ncbi:hypothetical protein [Algoriphagus hitonicola]|uniref:Uncharacterized protein n=1 Tax=Algoriphagus hitonicola TaxID=435880 RepID=A0A1I2UEV5_9BACT|nr:hypothetical protein [Algoriphagus hitonicola]SFG75568.1 hypothetical protein SAMN04487988_107207 [Algoriphagus hitonicola]
MKRYLQHLLKDIRSAHRPENYFEKEKHSAKSDEDELKEHFAEVDRFLNLEAEPTFSNYCGLEKEIFPPSDYYGLDELQQVNFEFRQMLKSWNLGIDLPKNLPKERVYDLMLGILDHPVLISEYGFFHFDFCTGNPEGCELDEYCSCLE